MSSPDVRKDPKCWTSPKPSAAALRQIVTLDPQLIEIIALSLKVTLTAVAIATLIGFAVGGVLAVYRFPGTGRGGRAPECARWGSRPLWRV